MLALKSQENTADDRLDIVFTNKNSKNTKKVNKIRENDIYCVRYICNIIIVAESRINSTIIASRNRNSNPY